MTNYTIKPIHNEADYQSALRQVGSLFEKEELTPEELNFLDVMSILIENWENRETEQTPIQSPSIVDMIEFRMEALNLKRRDLIPYIGSASKVNEVMNGKRNLTVPMIRALHKHLSIPLEFLCQESLPAEDSFYDEFLKEVPRYKGVIKQLGWEFQEDISQKLHQVIEDLGGFDKLPKGLVARKNDENRESAKTDRLALLHWMIRLLYLSKNALTNTAPYKPIDFSVLEQVVRFSVFPDGLKQAIGFLKKQGIVVQVLKHPKRTYLDGATLYFQDHPIIGLTLRYDRIDSVWFTLMHELSHVLHDCDALQKGDIFTDDITIDTNKGKHSDIEQQADKTAKEALIPHQYQAELDKLIQFPTLSDLLSLAGKIGINPAIVAGRVRYELGNYRIFKEFSSFKTGLLNDS